MALRITFAIFTVLLLVGCGFEHPFGPTDYEVVDRISANQRDITSNLGESHDILIVSPQGKHLDRIWFGVSDVSVTDPECQCERRHKIGSIEKVRADYIVYHAPTEVRNVSLPVKVHIYIGAGDRGTISSAYKTISTITIMP